MSAQAHSPTAPPYSPHALLARYRRLMSPRAWNQIRAGMTLGALNGAFSGLALAVLLPASVALSTGQACWGLGLGGWLVVLGGCALGAAVCDFQGHRIELMGALGFIHDVHHAVGDQVARVPLSWFNSESSGRLSRAVTQEMLQLSQTAAHALYEICATSGGIAVVWLLSWAWDWRLGALLTAAVPMLVLILRWSRLLLDRGKAVSEPAEQELAARIVEFARCQGALRSCRVGADYPGLTRAFEVGARVSRRTLWWETAGNLLSGALTQIIIVAMIVTAAALALSGALMPLEAIATVGMCLRFTTMLSDLAAQVLSVEERRQMMNNLDEVMDVQVLPVPRVSAELTEPGAGGLDGVRFGYRPGAPVLRGLSARIPAGSMCAVVGPSGCGKTTLARLVARFYDVEAGAVRVGGADVRELTTEDLMAQISMVFQDIYLFDDTLEANIRIGDPQADDARVPWAAELAGVSEIIERLPGGWRARVGEGGRALSGGERQRVSIARALLKRAPIVLIDEATSALDAENEANIVAAMEELRRDSTLIVIAHKLETVRAADQILVLGADGRLAQTGSHDDLVERAGPYREFWDYRRRARGWELV